MAAVTRNECHHRDLEVRGMSTVTAPAKLGTQDRCDRCGAQAYVLVRLKSGSALQFCAHHYTEHSAALKPMADEIIDESHLLLQP